MALGADAADRYAAPTSGPASKREVVRELGELALVLPSMVNQALEANDRAKYYLTLLQASATHARRPDRPAPSLHGERLAGGDQRSNGSTRSWSRRWRVMTTTRSSCPAWVRSTMR